MHGAVQMCDLLGPGTRANNAYLAGRGRGSWRGTVDSPPELGPASGDSGPLLTPVGRRRQPPGPDRTCPCRAAPAPQGFPSLRVCWALVLTLELSDAYSPQPHPEPSVCSAANAERPTQAWEQ